MALRPAAGKFGSHRAATGRRAGSLIVARFGADATASRLVWAALVVVAVLGLVAPVRRTGDAHQYHAMAAALAGLRPPALTEAEVMAYSGWLSAQPADSGFPGSVRAVRQPALVVDGRQEFSHFWFYPMLAAPFVAAAAVADIHPGHGFFAANVLLLGLAVWAVARSSRPVLGLLLLATPIVWFVNKAQVEVFTFAVLCLAMAAARRGWFLWAGLAVAIASTQNAPILVAVPCFWAAALFKHRLAEGRAGRASPTGRVRAVLLVGATVVIGALHPAYYLIRLGVPTPQRLNGGIDAGWPSAQRYLAVLLDPDLGLLAWVPALAALALVGGIRLLRRDSGDGAPTADTVDLRLTAACGVAIGGWFLFVFAQTTNVNSGGTVHVSRYALWLIPLLLPTLEAALRPIERRRPALLPVLATVVFAAYAVAFRPALPERYVTPSPQSDLLNAWLPGVYRQVPEVFFERHRGIDGAEPDVAADRSCTVILLGAATPDPPCVLTGAEQEEAQALFAKGWRTVWIVRPGKLGFGGGVSGATRVA